MIILCIWMSFFLEGIICFLLRQFVPFENYETEISLIIVFVNTLSLILLNFKIYSSNQERVVLNSSFIILTILICVDRLLIPFDTTDPDGFNDAALKLVNGQLYRYDGLYTLVVGCIYILFGPLRIVAQYTNALLLISSAFFLKQICDTLRLNNKSRIISFFLVCYAPFFLFYSAVLRRESLIAFLVIFSLCNFINWMQNSKWSHFFAALLLSFVASSLHAGTIVVALAYLIFFTLFDKSSNKFVFRWYSIFAVLCLCFFCTFLFNFSGKYFFGKFQGKELSVQNESLSNISGGAGYVVPTVPISNNFVYTVINTPLRCFYYLFSPMPWDWRGPFDIIAFLFSSTYYGIGLFVAIKYLKERRFSKEKKYIVILCLLIIALSSICFGWGVKNAGTAIRHRDKFIFVYSVLVAICFDSRKYLNRR